MRRLALFLLILMTCLSVDAQKGKPAHAAQSRQQTAQKPKNTQQKPKQQTVQKKKTTQQQGKVTVQSLTDQRKKIAKEHEKSVKREAELKQNVKKGMDNLMALDTEIAHQRMVVDTIRQDITTLNGYINTLDSQLVRLEKELEDRKVRYMKSMRFMHRNRSVQSQMAFVFSADNFNQMFRRMRFNREYAAFQKAQGEAIQAKQEQVTQKRYELNVSKQQKDTLLRKGEHEQRRLEGKQTEQKEQIEKLKKEQKTVQALIVQQQKQEAELNARIDKLIAEEIAREKARQEAEARKQAEQEAAKKREAELARKRAAAEAARKENERRIAEAKAKEEEARKAAEAAAAKSAREKEKANQQLQAAKKQREKVEQEAKEEQKRHNKDIAQSRRSTAVDQQRLQVPKSDVKLSGSFEANRGRLPVPVAGAYRLIRGFGLYTPEGVSKVMLRSNGWHLKGEPGAKARCIFNGVVSGVYVQDGKYIITVRHGKYISAYINLSSSNVRTGQKVSTGELLGNLGADNTMQFQLRNWSQLLNPSRWLRR